MLDLTGRWEGWYFEELGKTVRATVHEIEREGDSFAGTTAWGEHNKSVLEAAIVQLLPARTTPCRFIWTYDTAPMHGMARSGDEHHGTHVMELVLRNGERFLEGHYYNDRRRPDGTSGSGGAIRLKYGSEILKHELAFQETSTATWAMPEWPSDLQRMYAAATKLTPR